MTVKDFASALVLSLTERGIGREDAVNHVLTLSKTLTEDDLREITEYRSPEDFTALSDSLAEIIKEKNEARKVREQENDAAVKTEESAKKPAVSDLPGATRTFDVSKLPEKTPSPEKDARESAPEPQEIILGDDSSIKEKPVMTARGKLIFWAIVLLTLPLSLTALGLCVILFVLSVCAICAFIVASFGLVLCEIAAGGAGFSVGLVYGILKIVNGYTGVGLYEMGIGVACLGVTLVIAFLTYCFATKTLPYLLREVLAFWGIAFRRLGLLTERFREECNKL